MPRLQLPRPPERKRYAGLAVPAPRTFGATSSPALRPPSLQSPLLARPPTAAPPVVAPPVAEPPVSAPSVSAPPVSLAPPVAAAAPVAETPQAQELVPEQQPPPQLLPDGWEELFTEDGTPYYFHTTSQTTTWETPTPTPIYESTQEETLPDTLCTETPPLDETHSLAPENEEEEQPASEEIQPLPEGWHEYTTEEGLTYFFYEPDQITTWERPMMVKDEDSEPETSFVQPEKQEVTEPQERPEETAVEEETPVPVETNTLVEPDHDVTFDNGNDDALQPPLPEGWSEVFTDDGVPYYFCATDQTTSWERPVEPEPLVKEEPESLAEQEEIPTEEPPIVETADVMDIPDQMPENEEMVDNALPPGWIELFTEAGEPYYMYEPDQTTTWDRPVNEAAAVAEEPCQQDEVAESLAENVDTEPDHSPQIKEVSVDDQPESCSDAQPDDHDSHPADLPPGWTELQTDDGTPFYLYEPDQSVTWERPTLQEFPELGVPPEDMTAGEQVESNAEDTNPIQEPAPEQVAPSDDGETNTFEGPPSMEPQLEVTEEPTANEVAPDVPLSVLPPGWVELMTDDGVPYFLYEPDQSTTWDRPVVETAEVPESTAMLADTHQIEEEVAAEKELDTPEQVNDDFEETPAPETTHARMDDPDPVLQPLQPGWSELRTEDGTPYYLFEADQTVTWDRPVSTATEETTPEMELSNDGVDEQCVDPHANTGESDPVEEPVHAEETAVPPLNAGGLPHGWQEIPTEDGTVYYFHEIDNITTWERPQETTSEIEPSTDEIDKPPDDVGVDSEDADPVAEPDPPEETTVPPMNDAGLPPGWQEIPTEDGNVYYFNEIDNITTWDRPVHESPPPVAETTPEPVAASVEMPTLPPKESVGEADENPPLAEDPLPPGWTKVLTETGTAYYYNENTQETTWDIPMATDNDAVSSNTGPQSNSEPEVRKPEEFQPEPIINSDGVGNGREISDDTRSEEFSYEEVDPSPPSSGPLKDDWVDMDMQEDAAGELMPGWKEFLDVDSGLPYYMNETDGSTSWERPVNTKLSSIQDSAGSTPEETGKEAIDQGWTTTDSGFPEPEKSAEISPLAPGWTEEIDPNTSAPYYYNEQTGETSWERPSAANVPSPDGREIKSRDLQSQRSFPAIVSFGFGGRVCIIRPQQKDIVKIYKTHHLVPNEPICKIVASKKSRGIYGPLVGTTDEIVERYVDENSGLDNQLLWSLVSIASRSRGRLRSSRGPGDPSSPEAMIIKLLLNDYVTPSIEGDVTEATGASEHSLGDIEELLLMGKRGEAVDKALDSGNFALAFLIASMLGHEALSNAVERYVKKASLVGRPLHALAFLFSGLLKPTADGAPNYWDQVEPETLRKTWKYQLAGILNNPVEKWEHLIVALGKRLSEVDTTNAISAHVCYIVCGCSVGSPNKGALMRLLGCNPTPVDLALQTTSSLYAFELTEAYEWAKRRGNGNATIRCLQAFKIAFANLLCDCGFMESSKLYLESAIECLGSTMQDSQSLAQCWKPLSCLLLESENEDLVSVAAALYCRCSGNTLKQTATPEKVVATPSRFESGAVDVNASFMTAHTHINEDEASLAGPGSPEPVFEPISTSSEFPPIPAVSHGGGHNPVGFSPQPPAVPQPPIESAVQPARPPQVQEIVENKKPPTLDTVHSSSNENNGTPLVTPAPVPQKPETAPMSAPANLQPSKSNSKSSGKSKSHRKKTNNSDLVAYSTEKSFFDFGLREYVTKKINPNAKTADLGGRMEAYFDEDKKVWVFPGEDPAEKVKPIPPPPTSLNVPAPSQSTTPISNDPLAAMMAPPSRAPSAKKATSRAAPGKPAGFPPGMPPRSAPPKPVNFSAFAAPPQNTSGG